MIVQKINAPQVENNYELAFKYFSILSIVNNLELVKRDCQLLAYSVTENKDVSEIKMEFVKKFDTSMATVGNIISKLYKRNILKKEKRVVKVNPALIFDFNNSLALGLVFKHKEEE